MKARAWITLGFGFVLLASCADVWIVKRKYNRGYFVDFHHREKVKVAQLKRDLKREHRGINERLELRFQPFSNSYLNKEIPVSLETAPSIVIQGSQAVHSFPKSEHIRIRQVLPVEVSRHKNPERQVQSSKLAAKKSEVNRPTFTWIKVKRFWVYGIAGLMLGVHLLCQRVFQDKIMSMSRWAGRNKTGARILLAGLSIGSFVVAMGIGRTLHASGYEMGPEFIFSAAGIGGGLLLFSSWNKTLFHRFKAIILPALMISGSIITVSAGYHTANRAPNDNPVLSVWNSATGYTSELYREPLRLQAPYEILKKDMHRASPDTAEAAKPPKTFLGAIVLALFILFLLELMVLGVACMLACAGAEVLAMITFFIGTIVSLIFVINWLVKDYKERYRWR